MGARPYFCVPEPRAVPIIIFSTIITHETIKKMLKPSGKCFFFFFFVVCDNEKNKCRNWYMCERLREYRAL